MVIQTYLKAFSITAWSSLVCGDFRNQSSFAAGATSIGRCCFFWCRSVEAAAAVVSMAAARAVGATVRAKDGDGSARPRRVSSFLQAVRRRPGAVHPKNPVVVVINTTQGKIASLRWRRK